MESHVCLIIDCVLFEDHVKQLIIDSNSKEFSPVSKFSDSSPHLLEIVLTQGFEDSQIVIVSGRIVHGLLVHMKLLF